MKYKHNIGEYVGVKHSEYVIINNRAYNPITGLPVDDIIQTETTEALFPTEEEVRSRGITTPSLHKSLQKSQTLSRKYVGRPTAPEQLAPEPNVHNYSPVSVHRLNTKQAAPIQKFTSPALAPAPKAVESHRPAQTHPVTMRAHNQSLDVSAPRRQRHANLRKRDERSSMAAPKQQGVGTPKPAHILKNEAIAEAMNREVASQKKVRRARKQHTNRFARLMSMAVPSLAVIMLAGYFTYLSMPNLSIRMAAVQSGVDATYPGYRPSGYALRGPVSFRDGEVSMRFAYADGGHDFTLTQSRSNWTSATLKEQFSETPDTVTTTTIDGLTIYSQGNKASWVNSGILYTIDGEANLSNNQIQRIATSM